MNRRDAIAVLLAAGAAATVGAQAPAVRRIGVLMVNSPEDRDQQARLAFFRERLSTLGWVEGRNLAIEVRWSAGNASRALANAREMAATNPDLILSSSTPVTLALRKQTQSIPVVFIFVSDPVGSGLVKSLSRPGGNITGLVNIQPTLVGKWLELLKRIAPKVARVTVVYNPDTAPYAITYLRGLSAAADEIGVKASTAAVRSPSAIEETVATLGRDPASGLVGLVDSFLSVHRAVLVSALARYKVPAMHYSNVFVADGGLISYGIDAMDQFQRAAAYVDRILRGARPADLPVELPTKYHLAVNVKAAAALGLAVPHDLLLSADQVIE